MDPHGSKWIHPVTTERFMNIENFGAHITHVTFDPSGWWARSSSPHLLILTDYDNADRLIRISFAGPLAHTALSDGIPAALQRAESPEILNQITVNPPATLVDTDELAALRVAVDEVLAVAA